ncbi:MAG: hypothetical protein ACR2OZ_14105 [Verrucomicrobiales bacterium]
MDTPTRPPHNSEAGSHMAFFVFAVVIGMIIAMIAVGGRRQQVGRDQRLRGHDPSESKRQNFGG